MGGLKLTGENQSRGRLWGGAGKSLARPTSRCRRMESIVSLERGVCSRAELQVFSLQRLKGSMSGNVRDFNNIETWAVIKFFFLQGKALKEIHAILTETLGEHAPLYATVTNWVAQFKFGAFSTCDVPRPGWPKTVTTLEIIDQIHELILEDRRISAKSIAEQLGISREQVESIIHEDLDMWKLSTKWVPKRLNADRKHQWCQSSEQLLESFRHNPNNFLSWLVTMDETWLYHYDPETRQQLMEWQQSGSPCPKKFRVQKSAGKVVTSIFWDQKGILRIIIQRAKLSITSITHLCWCNWRTFWRKNAAEGHQGGLVLARQCPGSPGTCNPEETGQPGLPLSWSPTLFSGSGPVRLPPVPWTEKTIARSPFFVRCRGYCCHRDLVERATFWIFFEWLAKVTATG